MDEDLQEILAKVAQDAVDAYIKETYKQYWLRKKKDPEYRARKNAYGREYQKNRRLDSDYKKREAEYNSSENRRAYRREYMREKRLTLAYSDYRKSEEYKLKRKAYDAAYRAKKKAEKEALKNDNDQ